MIFLVGLLITLCCTFLQALLVASLVRALNHTRLAGLRGRGLLADTLVICAAVAALFIALIAQVAIWAVVFFLSGELSSFGTAFYFPFVNFTSLGYGDITLSDSTAILDPIEAANGIIMLGLSTSFLLALVNSLVKSHGKA